MTKLMHSGKSWSGHERNCAYLNVGDGTFVDVSAATGLDFLDDGRSMASSDWDNDGDLDILLKNRTGPQLRFLRNDAPAAGAFVAFKLVGTTCNRDAIGARITIKTNQGQQLKALQAGDGYLAQSSKWVHFGLDSADSKISATIQWPDGKSQRLSDIEPGQRYEVTQGAAPRAIPKRPRVALRESSADDGQSTHPVRIVLRQPLASPPSLRSLGKKDASGPTLVTMWAQWCAPCRNELKTLASEADRLRAASIHVVALNVDQPGDREKAQTFLDVAIAGNAPSRNMTPVFADEATIKCISAIVKHIRDQNSETLALPMSLLISAKGDIQILYMGSIPVDTFVQDAAEFGHDTARAFRRAAFPGRWFFRIQRNLAELAAELRRVGNTKDAECYDAP